MCRYVLALSFFFALGFVPFAFSGKEAWAAYSLLSPVKMFTLSMIAMSVVPYERTQVKALLTIPCGWYFAVSIENIVAIFLGYNIPLFYVGGVIFVVFCLFYIFSRMFDRPSDEINDTDIFVVYKRPRKRNKPIRDALDLVLSLFGKEGGGKFVVCRGNAYRFKHGVIVEQKNIHKLDSVNYLTVRSRLAKDKDVNYLKSIVGTKWSLFKNCYLIFLPVERDYAHKKCKSI